MLNAERKLYDETKTLTIRDIQEIEERYLWECMDDEERFFASMQEEALEEVGCTIINFEDLVNPDPDPDPVEMAIAA